MGGQRHQPVLMYSINSPDVYCIVNVGINASIYWKSSKFPTSSNMEGIFVLFCAIIGSFTLLPPLINLLTFVYSYFIRQPKNLKLEYGPWAIVTGATDGIGRSIAFQLAKNGLNLILLSRNADKLTAVAVQIKERYANVRIKTVTCDLSRDVWKGGVERVEEAMEAVEVGVLVNCAGATYTEAAYFDEVKEGVWKNVVDVNVVGTTMVTKAVVRRMVKRGRGAVVNVGSGAASAVPSFLLYAIYSATKAYLDKFSKCLYVEYKNKGIDVQCQIPLYVDTKMASIGKSSLFVPSPDTYACAAVRWIGYEPLCTPYWSHSVLWYFFSIVPEFVFDILLLYRAVNIRKKQKSQCTVVKKM